MIFTDAFHIDEEATEPAIEQIANTEMVAGSYNGGLISILDKNLSSVALTGWRWLLGEDAVGLVATAVGDLFFWSEKHSSIYFLEVQRGQSTFVGKDIKSFWNDFLVKDGVKSAVLHFELFESLNSRLGHLSYGNCFIAEPWVRLGGSGNQNTYVQGELAVYLNLVGQSVEHAMKSERARERS